MGYQTVRSRRRPSPPVRHRRTGPKNRMTAISHGWGAVEGAHLLTAGLLLAGLGLLFGL